MKLRFLKLFADRFALIADVNNPTHVNILHWIKNEIQYEILLDVAVANGFVKGAH